jgi:hypothetical protein
VKYLAISAIFSRLGAGFEISVKLQDSGVVRVLAMLGKDSMQTAKKALLPVDEGSVAIEGEEFDSTEVER